ncbi:MAG: hypothetical protein Q8Q26_07305 [Pseudorhodobacter sp.]|nr:hypothetical protein [Pseudorhodobacter sp.]
MKRRLAVASVVVLALGGSVAMWRDPAPPVALPETVLIAAGQQDYRPAGEFRQGTRVVDAPKQQQAAAALEIMKYQVSEAAYALCVAESACPPAPSTGRPDFAQTNINHADATAYAHMMEWMPPSPTASQCAKLWALKPS